MNKIFSDCSQIGMVSTFSELVNTDFVGEKNALCWYRNLQGDFKEIVDQLQLKENITKVDPEELLALQLSQKGNVAREIILNDFRLLADFGASPSLNASLRGGTNSGKNKFPYFLAALFFVL